MDEFRLQRQVYRELLKSRPTVEKGMRRILDVIRAKPNGSMWRNFEAPRWTAIEADWLRWFERCLRDDTVPAAQLWWFETPDCMNEIATSVAAYATLQAGDEGFGSEAEVAWPRDERMRERCGLRLTSLDRALEKFRESLDDDELDAATAGEHAIVHACLLLVVLNGLPRSKLLVATGLKEIGVITGWKSGEADPVGLLSERGWRPLRPSRRSRPTNPAELDPSTPFSFDVKKFLANGGDPNRREAGTGRTPLMMRNLDRAETLLSLLRAGADARAVDDSGRTVLHHLGACELSAFRELLKRGADPRVVCRDGQSVADVLLKNGRCTLAHFRLAWAAGSRFARTQFPLHQIAYTGTCYRDTLKHLFGIMRLLVENRFDVNAVDQSGRSPLWTAIERHSEAHIAAFRGERSRGYGDYHYDSIAVQLLELGANPNERYGPQGSSCVPPSASPLMCRRYDDSKLVRALLKHGADPNAVSGEGFTAADYARSAITDPLRVDGEGAAKVLKILERAARSRRGCST